MAQVGLGVGVGGGFQKDILEHVWTLVEIIHYGGGMVDVGKRRGNNWRRKVFEKEGGHVLQDSGTVYLPLKGGGTLPPF